MAYEYYCAACTYLGETADYNGKYPCDRGKGRHYATDAKCLNFCEAYSRPTSSRKNMIEVSQRHHRTPTKIVETPSPCYLTTIMCQLLGFEDNNYYLNILRYFRDNVMQKNPNYLPLLLTYDVVGPIISRKLATDPDGKNIAVTYFNNYILKAVTAIENEKNEAAIAIYKTMTELLASKYEIPVPVIELNEKEIEPTKVGHGRIRKPNYNY